MPGPCSLPNGGRREYEEMGHIVCDLHKDCTPDSHQKEDKNGASIHHVWMTYREWMLKRGKLRTGKTA